MPRLPRQTYAHVPHHVVQRGCRRDKIFFCEADFRTYLQFLDLASKKYAVEIWCYCLMNNHIHLIALPKDEIGLSKMISHAHRKYSLYINRKNNWKGHLWEYRFKSYPMDDLYLSYCVRYILRNPVHAQMVDHPCKYEWSSALSLCERKDNGLLGFTKLFEFMKDWKIFIEEPTPKEILEQIEKHQNTGSLLFG